MKKAVTLILFFILFNNLSPAQIFYDIRNPEPKYEIPFEYINNFIVIKVVLNNTFPLKFIFDTGAENTIITKREITDLLHVNYLREFNIVGSDLKTVLTAYLVQGVSLELEDLMAVNRAVLVLKEDYFRFEEMAGIEVHGILGADFFRRFIVKIDYRRKIITLFDPAIFKPPGNKYVKVPVDLNRNKPYVNVNTIFANQEELNVKLLLDSGAGVALLLFTNSHPNLKLPAKHLKSNIGRGLGGHIEGFIGRVPGLELGPYTFENISTNFQDIIDLDTALVQQKNGIIGNQILDRFIIIIDYIKENIYLRPTKAIRRKFEYDKSGLTIAASGMNLNKFTVIDIVSDSPAAEAGIEIGDRITKLNGSPAFLMTLEGITRKLRKKEGKKIKINVRRDRDFHQMEFLLRDLI